MLLLGVIFWIYSWESPAQNDNSQLGVADCIDNGDKVEVRFSQFNVSYVENSSESCVNPYFPSIKISSTIQHNAWLHIVRTNNKDWEVFIDTVDKDKYPKLYPFYTKIDNPYSQFKSDNNFYDAPLWSYRLWHDETIWIGNAYPIEIDDKAKVITFSQGISWGFKFGNFKLRPSIIHPKNINVLTDDLEIFKQALSGYKIEIIDI